MTTPNPFTDRDAARELVALMYDAWVEYQGDGPDGTAGQAFRVGFIAGMMATLDMDGDDDGERNVA